MVAHNEKEQTFNVHKGQGTATIGDETEPIKAGDVIFVPRNTPHTTEAGKQQLEYLCLNSIVTKTQDVSFEDVPADCC